MRVRLGGYNDFMHQTSSAVTYIAFMYVIELDDFNIIVIQLDIFKSSVA